MSVPSCSLVWKSTTIVVLLSMSHINSVNICFTYLGVPKLVTLNWIIITSSWMDPYHYIMILSLMTVFVLNLFCVILLAPILLYFVYHLYAVTFWIPSLFRFS
jgi:hypothetical protein